MFPLYIREAHAGEVLFPTWNCLALQNSGVLCFGRVGGGGERGRRPSRDSVGVWHVDKVLNTYTHTF